MLLFLTTYKTYWNFTALDKMHHYVFASGFHYQFIVPDKVLISDISDAHTDFL